MTKNNQDKEYPLPIDHPRLAAIAGWIYNRIFQPMLDIADRLEACWTNKMIEDHTSPEDKLN